uniref:Putative secreted peptide n=1 Tax=Anopheles braziliensis TaxID=58242 RepID=A0A2M3ZPY5_9DIPT
MRGSVAAIFAAVHSFDSTVAAVVVVYSLARLSSLCGARSVAAGVAVAAAAVAADAGERPIAVPWSLC